MESISLIGAHGYCSQEMVNLLLTGHAVSNTFDGYLILEESGVVSQNKGEIMPGYFHLYESYLACPTNILLFVCCCV